MGKAVVFDLDGTIVCLPINWELLFEEFKRIMKVDTVRPIVDTVARVDGKTQLEVFAIWDKAELAVAKRVTFCQEGAKLYRENLGKTKALVTLQGRKVVDVILKEFSLNFDVVITREDSLFRPEQLMMASEKLDVPLRDLLFIGNADSDEAAAQKVGCQFKRVK